MCAFGRISQPSLECTAATSVVHAEKVLAESANNNKAGEDVVGAIARLLQKRMDEREHPKYGIILRR